MNMKKIFVTTAMVMSMGCAFAQGNVAANDTVKTDTTKACPAKEASKALAAFIANDSTATDSAKTATAALTSIQADYDKVQDVVYHGFVQLDASQGLAGRQNQVLLLVADDKVDTLQDFQALLGRVYTRDEAEDLMVYSFIKKGVLGEMNGALYRLEGGWTMGYPLDQPLLSARQTAPDTIVAQTTVGHADPVPATLTLKQEDGSWKIDEITI